VHTAKGLLAGNWLKTLSHSGVRGVATINLKIVKHSMIQPKLANKKASLKEAN